MRRTAAAVLAMALSVGTVSAARADSRDVVRIVGSSTVYPFAAIVAEAFSRTTPFKAPVIEQTGTGGGFKLFCAGVSLDTPDVVTASRLMTSAEKAACDAAGVREIEVHEIGYDGVVVVQARQDRDLALTRRQLWMALAKTVPIEGKMVENPFERWNEIDPVLPDRPIAVYGPPPTSGTRDVFARVVMEGGCFAFRDVRRLPDREKRDVCERMREDGRFVEAGEDDELVIRRTVGSPEALGIVGFNALRRHAHLVEGVVLEGVMPEPETIASGAYPVSRGLYLYVKTAHLDAVPGLRDFVREFTSDAARGDDGYLVNGGLIPLTGDGD